MHIQFLGLSSFKFITKDAVVVTDPAGKESGLAQPRGNADIVILAERENPVYSGYTSLSGPLRRSVGVASEPFLIGSPGEYDVKGVAVTGIPLKQGDRYVTIFLIESEDVKVLNLAHIQDFNITEDELESLGDIDVLILPVGGETVLSASLAAKAVNQIEPKVVIPSHYASKELKLKLDSVERFTKEMGGKAETMDKIILKKKDLTNSEGAKLVILTS